MAANAQAAPVAPVDAPAPAPAAAEAPIDPGMQAVDAFNAIAVAPEFSSIRDMTFGVHYPVIQMTRIQTQYGSKIKAELQDMGGESIFIVLPTRLARLSDEQISDINNLAMAGHNPLFCLKGMKGPSFDVQLVYKV